MPSILPTARIPVQVVGLCLHVTLGAVPFISVGRLWIGKLTKGIVDISCIAICSALFLLFIWSSKAVDPHQWTGSAGFSIFPNISWGDFGQSYLWEHVHPVINCVSYVVCKIELVANIAHAMEGKTIGNLLQGWFGLYNGLPPRVAKVNITGTILV